MRLAAAALLLLVLPALAACGGGDGGSSAGTATTEAERIEAGRALFVSEGCGGCHVLAAAGTEGVTGPDLDQLLLGSAEAAGTQLEDHVRTAIVDPEAWVMPQYSSGVMPTGYGTELTAEEIDALVAFIVDSVSGGTP